MVAPALPVSAPDCIGEHSECPRSPGGHRDRRSRHQQAVPEVDGRCTFPLPPFLLAKDDKAYPLAPTGEVFANTTGDLARRDWHRVRTFPQGSRRTEVSRPTTLVRHVQAVMGHEKASTILDRYTHASPNRANRLRKLFADDVLTFDHDNGPETGNDPSEEGP